MQPIVQIYHYSLKILASKELSKDLSGILTSFFNTSQLGRAKVKWKRQWAK